MVIADKSKYLRGREPGEMAELWRSGATEAGLVEVPDYPDELSASGHCWTPICRRVRRSRSAPWSSGWRALTRSSPAVGTS